MKNRTIGFLVVSIGIITVALTSSCKKKDTTPTTTASCSATISYATDIAPMMTQNCTSCHNSSNSSGGYNLTTHGNVSNDAGIILSSMRHSGGVTPMPEGSAQMSSTIVDKFDCWIQQGKANN